MTNPTDFLRLHGPIQVATAQAECWKCHESTPCQSLMAEDVESFSSYPVDDEDGPQRTGRRTFIYQVSAASMPPELAAALGGEGAAL